MRIAAIGIPWYPRDRYAVVRAMMADAELLPATFRDFLKAAKKGEDELRRAGHAVIRVNLDTDEFPAFCRARGLDLDAQGRMAFASFVAARMAQDEPRGHA